MPPPATPEERAEVVALAVERGVRHTSEATGRTESCVWNWCKVAGVTPKVMPRGRRRTNIGPCSVAGCEGSALTAGMCKLHYARKNRADKRAHRPPVAVVPDLTTPTFRSPCHGQPIVDVTEPEQVARRIERQVGVCPTCGSRWRRTITVMPEPTPLRKRKTA